MRSYRSRLESDMTNYSDHRSGTCKNPLDYVPTSRYALYQPVGMGCRMVGPMTATTSQSDARTRLLDAAIHAIRAQGYSATTVDDICRAAGLTKGAFFHHFKSKDDLALAAAAHFSEMAEQLFGGAPYRQLADPLDRLLGYVDFRTKILAGSVPQFPRL